VRFARSAHLASQRTPSKSSSASWRQRSMLTSACLRSRACQSTRRSSSSRPSLKNPRRALRVPLRLALSMTSAARATYWAVAGTGACLTPSSTSRWTGLLSPKSTTRRSSRLSRWPPTIRAGARNQSHGAPGSELANCTKFTVLNC